MMAPVVLMVPLTNWILPDPEMSPEPGHSRHVNKDPPEQLPINKLQALLGSCLPAVGTRGPRHSIRLGLYNHLGWPVFLQPAQQVSPCPIPSAIQPFGVPLLTWSPGGASPDYEMISFIPGALPFMEATAAVPAPLPALMLKMVTGDNNVGLLAVVPLTCRMSPLMVVSGSHSTYGRPPTHTSLHLLHMYVPLLYHEQLPPLALTTKPPLL